MTRSMARAAFERDYVRIYPVQGRLLHVRPVMPLDRAVFIGERPRRWSRTPWTDVLLFVSLVVALAFLVQACGGSFQLGAHP